jgi:uncharacterized protein YkwD
MRISRISRLAAIPAAALLLATGTASRADEAQPTASPAPAVSYSPVGTWQLLALVNQRRHALGLPALKVDSRLAAIARRHAEQMAASGVLQHNDGLFSASSHHQLAMRMLGENVGWNFSVPAQHSAYLASAGHRANIQQRSFRVAGFAVVKDADGHVWSTEDFGSPTG